MGSVFIAGGKPAMDVPIAGVPASDLAVGSSIWLNENGTLAEYLVVNQGIPSGSSLYDESCNGTWLLRKDCYESRAWHSSDVNDYENSTIHSYLNSDFLSLFDASVQDAIKQVKIPYREGSTTSTTVTSGASGLSTKIFLFSCYEVGMTQSMNSNFPIDGACLSYFNGTAETDSRRIAYLNGTATNWFLRSPYTSRVGIVWLVGTSGHYYTGYCSASYGIRPALILPSDCKLTDNGEGKLILAGGGV